MTTVPPAASAEPPASEELPERMRECDIVMKGGITSGVVYPLAVCELAKDYRFRSIGGTSAGAIAAAATAAAEYGRGRGGTSFAGLEALPKWLGKLDARSGRSNLFALFQPQPALRRVFDVLTAGLGDSRGRMRRIGLGLVRNFPLAAFIGALPGLALVGLGTQASPAAAAGALVVVGAVLAAAGALGTAAFALSRRLRNELPRNGFGMCSGMPGAKGARAALTPWLAELLNGLAGKPRDAVPLTFGELWGAREAAEGDRAIDLRFMTTSLSHGRPYQLPFEGSEFYYAPDEFRELFPGWIVDWMEARSGEIEEERREKARNKALAREARAAGKAAAGEAPEPEEDAGEGEMMDAALAAEAEAGAAEQWKRVRPMPAAADLPVVVAARMSLSFPVLISAVPLYTVDYTRKRPRKQLYPERCWFSDGGICSNFPVHFFDAPLPARPTFAINLRPYHPDYQPHPADESLNSWSPDRNRGGQEEWWTRFEEGAGWTPVAGFAGAIVNAMQNWVDNTQLRVPGYRDRVVHVSLDESAEGGLNLNMPPEVIARLGERGRMAGRKLTLRFGPRGDGTALTWANHRWVRFRSTMQLLEGALREVRGQLDDPDHTGSTYEQLLQLPRDEAPSYRWPSKPAADDARKAVGEIQALEFLQEPEPVFDHGAPNPTPELRIMPKL